MAWFNRKVVTWTEQEIKWIEENAETSKISAEKKDKSGGAQLAKWFTGDLMYAKYKIAIYNLPPETDAPALIRMLAARGMKDCDLSGV